MNPKSILFAVLFLALLPFPARPGDPESALVLPGEVEEQAGGTDKSKQPEKKIPDPPKIDPFAPPAGARGEISVGYNPQMVGDLAGVYALQRITLIGTQTVTTTTTRVDGSTTTTTVTQPTSRTKSILVPVGSAGAFKVAENESPMPRDRAFLTYNYFANLRGPELGPNLPFNSTQTTAIVSRDITATTTTTTFIPPAPRLSANLHREVFGFEKTFLDGFASIEMRVPIVQQSSTLDGFGARFAGDLTIVGKYAFLLDPIAGDVLSGGLAVTAPTGPGIDTVQGTVRSTLLQPWVGYIANWDRFYVQGFHSIVVPTDARDVTLLFNDVGINFWLYRGDSDRRLSFIVPMLEFHVTTPLNHRGTDNPIFAPDLVSLTGGVHLGLFRSSTLSVGVVTPLTGPRPFNIEAYAQFNWRF